MSERTINVGFSAEEAVHLLWIIEKSSGFIESIDKHHDTWQLHGRIQAAWLEYLHSQKSPQKDGEPS